MWFTLVTIIYVVVIWFLIGQLKKINEQELRSEKRSIIRQFSVFLAGYTAGVVYAFIEYFNPTQYSYFVDQVSLSVTVIVWDVIPVTYMLFVHHRTFRSMIKQLSHSEIGGNGGADGHSGEIGYLRVASASVNTDSRHATTDGDHTAKGTGNFE